jgi:hypothetical protein
MAARWSAILFLLLFSPAVFADPQARPTTVEKQLFPPAAPRVFDTDLPVVLHALDALPEDAGLVRVYAIDSTLNPVQRWRRLLSSRGVDFSAYQYIGPAASGGAEAVLLSLTGGRVTRIGIFYPNVMPAKIAAPFQNAGADAVATERDFSVVVRGTKIIGDFAGNRDHPTLFEVAIDPTDWYLLNHPCSSPIADAIRHHTICIGMTVEQADYSIGVKGKPVDVIDGAAAYEWKKEHDEANFITAPDVPSPDPRFINLSANNGFVGPTHKVADLDIIGTVREGRIIEMRVLK